MWSIWTAVLVSWPRTKPMVVPVYLGEDIVAGVVAVVVRVLQGRPELVAGESGLRCPALHRDTRQLVKCAGSIDRRVLATRSGTRSGFHGFEVVGSSFTPCQGTRQKSGDYGSEELSDQAAYLHGPSVIAGHSA